MHPGPGKFPAVVRTDAALAFTLGESEHQRTSQSAGRRLPGWFFPTQVCSGFDSALSGSYQELVFLEGLGQPARAWDMSCGGGRGARACSVGGLVGSRVGKKREVRAGEGSPPAGYRVAARACGMPIVAVHRLWETGGRGGVGVLCVLTTSWRPMVQYPRAGKSLKQAQCEIGLGGNVDTMGISRGCRPEPGISGEPFDQRAVACTHVPAFYPLFISVTGNTHMALNVCPFPFLYTPPSKTGKTGKLRLFREAT